MYEERRNRNLHAGQWIADQRYKFCWDSHLWGKGFGTDHVYTRCEWCGWQPPGEYPLSDETPMCPKNPDVKKVVANEIERLGNRLGKALRNSFTDV